MSYFVTITFDLRDAKSSLHGTGVYNKITNALDMLDYSKIVRGKKKVDIQLPANTYVAEFDDDVDHTSEIIDFVTQELKKLFKSYHVKGKFFVSVGKNWSWKVGSF
ncbi:hypothetical protein [Imhoffiella purpurea]|uniref:hypothetical protein n=1 Tax=Imhoffiella purpurea TaxID=1249627 RepID=UPI0012FE7941|nr:hypothetical protein [Imhoffiella purpurea]